MRLDAFSDVLTTALVLRRDPDIEKCQTIIRDALIRRDDLGNLFKEPCVDP
jgi:hypothetical protein